MISELYLSKAVRKEKKKKTELDMVLAFKGLTGHPGQAGCK